MYSGKDFIYIPFTTFVPSRYDTSTRALFSAYYIYASFFKLYEGVCVFQVFLYFSCVC